MSKNSHSRLNSLGLSQNQLLALLDEEKIPDRYQGKRSVLPPAKNITRGYGQFGKSTKVKQSLNPYTGEEIWVDSADTSNLLSRLPANIRETIPIEDIGKFTDQYGREYIPYPDKDSRTHFEMKIPIKNKRKLRKDADPSEETIAAGTFPSEGTILILSRKTERLEVRVGAIGDFKSKDLNKCGTALVEVQLM